MSLDEVTNEEQDSIVDVDIRVKITNKYSLAELKQMTFYWNMVYKKLNLKVGDFVYMKSSPKYPTATGKNIDGMDVDVVQIGSLFETQNGTKLLAGN